MREVEVVPSAAALVESMRDFGYSLESALADVIDNSITANASNIWICTSSEVSNLKIAIIDDGVGMTYDVMIKAMPPGSRNPRESREKADLGRFGLGLKTASFSQCRKTTVATKSGGENSAACWDLDYVSEKDRWLVKIPEDFNGLPWFDRIKKTGTMVLWENLDRLAGETQTEIDDVAFNRRLSEVAEHLALVFHRFLSPDSGSKKVNIFLNERLIEAFDPFNSKNVSTMRHPEEVLRYNNQEIRVQAFTLPHHGNVSREEWLKFGGTEGYLKNQGFYVYRQKRLIIHGTWFGLLRPTAFTQLTRVRLDIDNSLDANWKIDVKKSSAQLPEEVRRQLKTFAERIENDGKRPFVGRSKTYRADREEISVWSRITSNDKLSYKINPNHPMLIDLEEKLSPDLKSDLNKILEVLGSALPIELIIADFGNDAGKKISGEISDETFVFALRTVIESLFKRGCKEEIIIQLLLDTDPFKEDPSRTREELLKITKERISE